MTSRPAAVPAHPAYVLGPLIVVIDAVGSAARRVPSGIIPHPDQHLLALPLDVTAKPIQELEDDVTHRSTFHKATHHLMGIVAEHAEATQGSGAGLWSSRTWPASS